MFLERIVSFTAIEIRVSGEKLVKLEFLVGASNESHHTGKTGPQYVLSTFAAALCVMETS